MANPEHLEILKQGVEAWNRWRAEDREIHPVLTGVDLEGANLKCVNLSGAILVRTRLRSVDLERANLEQANLRETDLRDANLMGANLEGANLKNANLQGAYLRAANLDRANLKNANLRSADFERAWIHGADLRHAQLEGASLFSAVLQGSVFTGASLRKANLRDTNFQEAVLGSVDLAHAELAHAELSGVKMHRAQLCDLDLMQTKGLEGVRHSAPSSIATDTLVRGQGQIPEIFLRGCGLSDWEIEATKLYNPRLTEAERIDVVYKIIRIQGESPIQVNPLFISYSHGDTSFIESLEERLNEKRIRYWRDAHDLKAGRLETQIDRAIRHNPIVLLVLSNESVESDWVEWEVTKARDLEKEEKRDVLCPLALDNSWKTCSWEGPLRRQVEKYNILDFSQWRDQTAIKRQFQKLVDGLEMFYPRAE